MAIADLTSLRGGSIMPANPRKTRLFSAWASVYVSLCLLGISLYANAMTRRAWPAMFSILSINMLRISFVRSTLRPLSMMRVQRSSTLCGAPFVRVRISFEWRFFTITDILFLVESNGMDSIVVYVFSICSRLNPAL